MSRLNTSPAAHLKKLALGFKRNDTRKFSITNSNNSFNQLGITTKERSSKISKGKGKKVKSNKSFQNIEKNNRLNGLLNSPQNSKKRKRKTMELSQSRRKLSKESHQKSIVKIQNRRSNIDLNRKPDGSPLLTENNDFSLEETTPDSPSFKPNIEENKNESL